MKLLESLTRHPVDNCVILTYNANLLFFEYMLFEPLYGAGCRNTLVICDPGQYQQAVSDVSHLRYAGQRYIVAPSHTSPGGAFHPKLIFLTSAEKGRLFLTSGNLTKAGYTENWEVVSLFEYDLKRPSVIAWQACDWAFRTLQRIVQSSDGSPALMNRLEQLLGTTPWLRQAPHSPDSELVWLLHNLDVPLLDQLEYHYRREDGTPVVETVVLSPYFDKRACAFAGLHGRFQPRRWRVYTHGSDHHLNRKALATALDPEKTPVDLRELSIDGRTVHAKALMLRTEKGVWLMTGSANFSSRALLHPSSSGNTEITVLRFEPDPRYFDSWLEQLTGDGIPLDPSSLPEPREEVEPDGQPRAFALVAARLQGRTLELDLADMLPREAKLTIVLTQDVPVSITPDEWRQDGKRAISLPMDPTLPLNLERPALVRAEYELGAETIFSNSVLVHNLDTLKRFGRPIERRERPRLPDGLTPDDEEHCIQILDMLNDLLTKNAEEWRDRRDRIASTDEQEKQEEQMEMQQGEEYVPEDHFVDEQIRRAAVQSGASFYTDYWDRLTYEDILRAALAAVRPLLPPSESRSESQESTPEAPDKPQPPPPPADDDKLRARLIARIENGFRRLVGSFQVGAREADYLERVPAPYVMELFVIILAYLREVWRQSTLKDEVFIELSIGTLTAFWGQAADPGMWESMVTRIGDDAAVEQEKRLALGAQTWIHTYLLGRLLERDHDQRLYDMAAWMRHVRDLLPPLTVLVNLLDDAYWHLWRFSVPAAWDDQSPEQVAAFLADALPRYNEATLLAEIAAWPGAKAKVTTQTIAHIPHVPCLEVALPLSSPADLDFCVATFTTFVRWPRRKDTAWACFSNTNPLVDGDIRSFRAFYRGDEQRLWFVVWPKGVSDPVEHEKIDVSFNELCQARTLADLQAL